ncbi:MAG: cobalamin biosynthesis protein CbiX [Verrucomicrobiae bacterium]|nr:cobalamin biosynthesis protein CbiX [Verrucomicrobiae bacterium]
MKSDNPFWKQATLVLVGHGSTINLDSSLPTFQHAKALKTRDVFANVLPAFWKEHPSFEETFDQIKTKEVYLVPNFIAEGYFTQTIIPQEFNRLNIECHFQLYFCRPVGTHPSMTQTLLHRAQNVISPPPPHETCLLLVGHGTERHENSGVTLYDQVNRLKQKKIYAEVQGAFMEQAPYVKDWPQLTAQPNVVVVPFFIANGLHSYEDIPVLLGLVKKVDSSLLSESLFKQNPYHVHDRHLWYTPAIGTEPEIVDVILDLICEYDATHARHTK